MKPVLLCNCKLAGGDARRRAGENLRDGRAGVAVGFPAVSMGTWTFARLPPNVMTKVLPLFCRSTLTKPAPPPGALGLANIVLMAACKSVFANGKIKAPVLRLAGNPSMNTVIEPKLPDTVSVCRAEVLKPRPFVF